MVATVEDHKLIAIDPDTDNEIYGGYTCIKGRQLAEQIYHPSRLQQSQKKQSNASYASIGSEQAMADYILAPKLCLERSSSGLSRLSNESQAQPLGIIAVCQYTYYATNFRPRDF